MGGRGAYFYKIGSNALKDANEDGETNEENFIDVSDKIKGHEQEIKYTKVNLDKKQIGKKISEHCDEFGLDPSNADDRAKYVEITKDIIENCTEIRVGKWRSQNGLCTFFIKDTDVVIVDENGKYITTMKDGYNGSVRVRNGRKIK